MIHYAVKDADGMYWCGMNYWDKQLRKARFYNSLKYAQEVMDDSRFKNMHLSIVKVELYEVSE